MRPLFEHEAERGEWDCVSPGRMDTRGVVVHEGCEKVKPNLGRVKALRHHAFDQVAIAAAAAAATTTATTTAAAPTIAAAAAAAAAPSSGATHRHG